MLNHGGIGSNSISRNQNDSGVIQRKLQRAYQEKELLLGEVQSLRQQLRSMSEQQKSNQAKIGVPAENIDGWNHLLEANMKSGTMACVWCLKTYYIKRIASAFGRWKCFSVYTQLSSNAGLIDNNNSRNINSKESLRFNRLCKLILVCPL